MRVLIACEFSGRVRDAFIERGHDAISCDILPTETPGPHIQDDVLSLPHYEYDLMVAFPPCTYLTYAGIAWWHRPGRAELRAEALEFVRRLMALPVSRWAIENPRGCIDVEIRRRDQVVQPWWFGEPWRKPIYLWLQNVPPLMATYVYPVEAGRDGASGWDRHNSHGDRKNRAHNRSKTLPGVAREMARQWGDYGVLHSA